MEVAEQVILFVSTNDQGLIDALLECMLFYSSCSLLHFQVAAMVSAKLQEEGAYKLFIHHTNIIHFLTQNYSLVLNSEEE